MMNGNEREPSTEPIAASAPPICHGDADAFHLDGSA
jgi:hypothetical protein